MFPGHFLDFPGDPLRPGCDYAEWSARINAVHPATVYAHVATDPGFPGSSRWSTGSSTFSTTTTTPTKATGSQIWFAASRTRWSDADPLPARRQRAWGQTVSAALRLFRARPGLFASFAAAFVVLSLVTLALATLQVARRDAPADIGAPTENATGFWASLVALAITILTVATYFALLAAVAATLDRTGSWRPGDRRAHGPRRGAFAVPIVIAERCDGRTALRRSRILVRGRWWRTAVPLAIVIGLGLAAGPIAGIILLLGTDLSPR